MLYPTWIQTHDLQNMNSGFHDTEIFVLTLVLFMVNM